MNKILLLIVSSKERADFEENLYEFVEAGGQLFIASNKGQALAILEREKPHLTFIDEVFLEKEEPLFDPHKIVVLCDKERKGWNCLIRPFTTSALFKKCPHLLKSKKAESILPL